MAEREKLIEILKGDTCPSPMLCDPNCKYANLQRCYEERTADYLLENDVQKVVRCKDCKYRRTEDCAMQYEDDLGHQMFLETDYDYCSWGKKWDGEENGNNP